MKRSLQDGTYDSTYENMFASLVCGGSSGPVAVSSGDFPLTGDNDNDFELDSDETWTVNMEQVNFVNATNFANCVDPIILFRRQGCTINANCGKNDPINTRWLAIASAGPGCSDPDLHTSDIIANPGGSIRVGGVGGTGAPSSLNSNPLNVSFSGGTSMVSINCAGRLTANLINLVRDKGSAFPYDSTYEKMFASLVCSNGIFQVSSGDFILTGDNDGDHELDSDETWTVDMDEANFVDPALFALCADPTILFRRQGCTTAAGCSADVPTNTLWLARTLTTAVP